MLNNLAKAKIYVGAVIMGLSSAAYYLGHPQLSQTLAWVGSSVILGLGLNSLGHQLGIGGGQAFASVLAGALAAPTALPQPVSPPEANPPQKASPSA